MCADGRLVAMLNAWQPERESGRRQIVGSIVLHADDWNAALENSCAIASSPGRRR